MALHGMALNCIALYFAYIAAHWFQRANVESLVMIVAKDAFEALHDGMSVRLLKVRAGKIVFWWRLCNGGGESCSRVCPFDETNAGCCDLNTGIYIDLTHIGQCCEDIDGNQRPVALQ